MSDSTDGTERGFVKCPKCGAERIGESINLNGFSCGSIVNALRDRDVVEHQSDACRIRERDNRIAELERQLAEVMTERDALRADAERYRWLRDMDVDQMDSLFCPYTSNALIQREQLDAAIDTARKEQADLPENEDLRIGRLRIGDMPAHDHERLVTWMRDPNRKPAAVAFTAGAARSAATAFEEASKPQ